MRGRGVALRLFLLRCQVIEMTVFLNSKWFARANSIVLRYLIGSMFYFASAAITLGIHCANSEDHYFLDVQNLLFPPKDQFLEIDLVSGKAYGKRKVEVLITSNSLLRQDMTLVS